jgi:hypothetical protein
MTPPDKRTVVFNQRFCHIGVRQCLHTCRWLFESCSIYSILILPFFLFFLSFDGDGVRVVLLLGVLSCGVVCCCCRRWTLVVVIDLYFLYLLLFLVLEVPRLLFNPSSTHLRFCLHCIR